MEEPYGEVVSWLGKRFEADSTFEPDLEAMALILIETMVSFRSMQWVFGKTPGDVDDDRFVKTWVDLGLAYAERRGLEP